MRVAVDGRKIFDFGIGTYLQSLLRGLAAIPSDDEYVIFAPASAREALPKDARFSLHEVEAPHYSLSELFRIGRAIRQARCDIFHAPHYVTPFTSVPMAVTVHDLIHLDFPPRNPLARMYAHWMIRRSVTAAERVLVVSRTVGESIARRYPNAAQKLVVTPNGIDPGPYQERDEVRAASFRSRMELNRRSVVLFVGNDKRHKNLETLLAAFSVIAWERQDVLLLLAGGKFERVTESPSIRKAGFLSSEDLVAAYQAATVLVMPSLYEGFGLPVLEAMAAGCPVIASDGGALPEIAGDAAMIFDGRSPEDLVEVLRNVLSDPTLRRELSARGVRRAALYPWSATARLTHEAYRACLTTR